MVAEPAVTPVTTPAASTVATPDALLLHVPPAAASVSVTEEPAHTDEVPVMVPAAGNGFTVTVVVTVVVPQLLVFA
jgi:hypothetical protein